MTGGAQRSVQAQLSNFDERVRAPDGPLSGGRGQGGERVSLPPLHRRVLSLSLFFFSLPKI